MPEIRPFRGLLYNPQKIQDLARVVTEPYDVISLNEQQAYYEAHPYNIIRLILGKRFLNDNNKNNQYTRAKRFFSDWQKRHILLRDKKQAIYIYEQSFPHNDKRKTRTGFVTLLKLEDFAKNAILPHENTFSYAVRDRLELLKTVHANLCPIFGLFSEPSGKINKILSQYKKSHPPCTTIKKDHILHRLWRMSDKRNNTLIQRLLKGRQIFIADGHHRYEAALNYKLQMQGKKKRGKKIAPFDYVMAYLVATNDPGLTILPTHRAVRIKGDFNLLGFIQNLRKFFQLQKFSQAKRLFSYLGCNKGGSLFGAYIGKNQFLGLKLKSTRDIYKIIGKDKQDLHKDLDVAILHSFIIEHLLKINASEEDIYYTRDAQEAIKLVDQEKYCLAFFLKPTTVRQVKRVASLGGKMPHKSTYFYPKLLSGLVINKFL